ncbi:DUF3800 domain-containing protein [Aliiroseovarius crassostreae]|uniref:DUF3800 domain-containing protein n=1 Tax=Aliiroseovarius crassostreae TaxID=154981 RepID=A0A9Q9M044_9RHOB|nr:DUF3800 domain-containing protein [Aliiroseovarius crassostreae]UWP96214.1 DUF3800 domain-containing protein [Aliiroseovarius crassostreae]
MRFYIAYLDEFGHDGPFVSKLDPKYKTSPVFGLGGFLIPAEEARYFSTSFFKLKSRMFQTEISHSSKKASQWEKKGSDLFKPSKITKHQEIRNSFNRLLNELYRKRNGYTFYVGTEKRKDPNYHNSTQLYQSTLREAIKRIDEFCTERDAQFILCLDYHSNRAEMVKSSAVEMFGAKRKSLIEPLFHAESDLYQTLQFADWIAAVVGKIYSYNTCPHEFAENEPFKTYFGDRIKRASLKSGVRMQKVENTAMANAFASAIAKNGK